MPSLNKKMTNTRRGGLGLARLLLASAVAMALAAPQMSLPARATDMEAPITDASAQEAGGQFVKMGLNKSIVVKLPAEARDVIVGNPEIVDAVVRRKNMAYVFARAIGQSNIHFFDANGEQILSLDIEVAVDPLALEKLIRRALPGNNIKVETVNTNVILTGTARNAHDAKQAHDIARQFMEPGPKKESDPWMTVINAIRVAGEDQVMLKVKVVEIKRNALKQLGVDLQAVLNAGENVINLSNLVSFPLAGVPAAAGASITDNVGNTRFSGILRALENDDLSRTLAEPNLTALTGETASFHAGGQIPYSVCTVSDGVRQCEVEFKDYGVNLAFTPTVIDEGRINIKLTSIISDLSTLSINGIPGLDSRSTTTTLELPSGGSMMIAGLISESTRQNVNGLPGLKKLPILGSLFRSREFTSNETELVVLVTPLLVKSVAQKRLTTPDKNFNPATERQSLFFGKLHKNYGTGGKYNGNVGFIVE